MNIHNNLTDTVYKFDDWLELKCEENYRWININNYALKLKGKTFRIFDEQYEIIGKIIGKKNKHIFYVSINNSIQEMKETLLRNSRCDIDTNTMTNRDFCVRSAMKYIKSIKNKDDIFLNISEDEFIHRFSHVIYKNSQFK
jgi:hypothetical protein